SAYEASDNISKAIDACRTAITRNGSTAADYTHFVNVVLSSHDALPDKEQQELLAVVDHFQKETTTEGGLWTVRCTGARGLYNQDQLETCTTELAKLAPKDPTTVSFLWALAVQKHDRTTALQLIDRARGIGMSSEWISRMEAGTDQMTRRFRMKMGIIGVGA